jgi:hypothetical protein
MVNTKLYSRRVVDMKKKTDLYTVDELLHLALLRNAFDKDDKEQLKTLTDKNYTLIKEEEVVINEQTSKD